MSLLIENTEKLIDEFNDEIKSDLSSKGIDNSNEASNSIKIETVQNGGNIKLSSKGVFYLEFLDKGRGPGRFPPVEVIKRWVETKPVEINPYLVGRKIAMEGTNIFKDNSKGIQLDLKRESLAIKIKENAPKWAKQDLLIKIKGINSKITKK